MVVSSFSWFRIAEQSSPKYTSYSFAYKNTHQSSSQGEVHQPFMIAGGDRVVINSATVVGVPSGSANPGAAAAAPLLLGLQEWPLVVPPARCQASLCHPRSCHLHLTCVMFFLVLTYSCMGPKNKLEGPPTKIKQQCFDSCSAVYLNHTSCSCVLA